MELAPIHPRSSLFDTVDSEQIESWPQELIVKIFVYLNELDLQRLARISHTMNEQLIGAVNYNETLSIRNFTQLFSSKLATTNLNSQQFENLKSMKNYIIDIKIQLIDVVKTMKPTTVDILINQKRPFPNFMQDIFELSKMVNRLSIIANDLKEIPIKPGEEWDFRNPSIKALYDISDSLIAKGKMDRVIVSLIMSIPNDYFKKKVFSGIPDSLARAGDRSAIEAAMLIPDEIKYKKKILDNVLEELELSGNGVLRPGSW